jgi:D-glycero-D-manno-heptose 1,7-bisphosphate phosphatase
LDYQVGSSVSTVFLDRDGVINRKMPEGQYVRSWIDFEMLPGVADAIGKLNQAGISVFVVSNQRGVALGYYTAEDVEAVHEALQKALNANGAHVERFYFCPHDRGECTCRKPLTGLFERARAEFPKIESKTSVMIGDSLSDVEFGRRAGMYTVFIVGIPETRRAGAEEAARLADTSCTSLQEAVDFILRRDQRI